MIKAIAIEMREKWLLAELDKQKLLQNKTRVYRTKIATKTDLNVIVAN